MVSKSLLPTLVALVTLLACREAMADTFYSKGATGDPTQLTSWTNIANANPANFTSGDTFVILNGCNFTIPTLGTWTVDASTAGTAATVQINSTGALTFLLGSGQGGTLKIGGNLVQTTASATAGLVGSGTTVGGLVEFTSSGTWTGSADTSNVKIGITVDSGATLNASSATAGFKLRNNTLNITVNGTLNVGKLTIAASGSTGGFTLGASGTLITATTNASGLPGIFSGFSAGKITLPTTANYVFNGTNVQVTGTSANNATMPTTVNNLTFSNSLGFTLSQATTVNGVLTLTAGKVTGNVTLGSSGTISGGSSTAYLNGQLSVPFAAPSSVSFTFPIGTASAYSPISLANFTDSGSDTLTASATVGQAPNFGSSGIDGSLYIARYWTLTASGGFVSPTYNFTGTYVAGDIQNSADPNNLIVRKWDGSSWSAPASSTSVPYTATGTSFTTSFGQFAAGQAQTTIPILDSTTKTAITNTSATLGATLENNYSLAVTDYGIVWSTSPNPTTANNKVQVGTTTPTLGSPFTANVTGLPVATTIYYRGYATSSSGTGYSTNSSFLTLTNEPVTQASGVIVATHQNGDLLVSWVRGNGSKCIVLAKVSSAVDSDPVDGSTYTASPTFGSGSQVGTGNYAAYLGTGTNVTLTGLLPSTAYYVAVYELNGSGGSENYLVPAATGNQTTVASFISSLTWTGSQDSDWNNANNWDLLQVPDVGTPAIIPSSPANQPVYSNPMTAAGFGSLTSAGILNISTNRFNSGAVLLSRAGGSATARAVLTVNTGGVMAVSGNIALTSNSVVTVSSGASLTASGQLVIGSNPTGGTSSGNANSIGIVTNNGGTISVGSTAIAPVNQTVNCLLMINDGTNSLGAVTVNRSSAGSSAYNALGTEGLIIKSGQTTMSGLTLSGASFLTAWISGGTVTNNGSVIINQASSPRGSRLLQTGGFFVVTNLVNPNPAASGSLNVYSVTGGTNLVGGLSFGFASGSAGNVYFTNGATVYVGSLGMAYDNAVTLSAVLSGGSLLGASSDWTGSAPLQLDPGTSTIQAADLAGAPHNVTLSGVLSGTGGLTKTGAGTLTLNAADIYAGNTLISAGKLALGASGSLSNSGQITVGSGSTFDVTLASSFTVPAAKTLGGLGAVVGNVSFASTASLSPGINATRGTLTFSNSIALTGTAMTFDFTSNPSSPDNDSVTVVGTLDVTGGGNTVDVTGTGPAGSKYPLFKYGSLNGNLSNISLTAGASAIGYLTNDTTVTPNMIAYVVTKTVHSPTNTTWVGNQANNIWDSLVTTNWVINGSLDYFINGDSAIFNSVGQANSNVVISTTVLPASTTVNSSGDYVFSGSGAIGGLGGITKTNTGRLTIRTTNTFTGGVSIKQGAISVSILAADNTPSPLGQTGTLLVDGGSLEYTGPSTSWTRPLAVGTNGGTVSLPSGVSLSYSGTISGSGPFTKADLGTLTLGTANSYAGTYLSGGTLALANVLSAGSGSIAFTGNSTLSLVGGIKPANTIVLSNYSGAIQGGDGGGLAGIKSVVGSSNLLLAVTTGVFDLTGDMSAYSGTLTCSNAGGATVRLNGSNGSRLATWDLGSGTMELNTRASTASCYFGALMGSSSSSLVGHNASDTLTPATYYIGDNGLSTTFDGTIKDGLRAGQVLSIVKVGTGTLTLSGANTYTGTTTVSNGTLQVNGSLASGSTVSAYGGAIAGTGTIGGPTTLNDGATLNAGVASTGGLTFNNNLTLSAASTNIFAVTSGGGTANPVTVNGQLSPNSSLIKVNTGAPLAIGTYTLFNYSSANGSSFNATPVFDVAPAGGASIVDTGSGQINLVIASGPSGPATIANGVSGSTLNLTWPSGQGWRLVSQTNSLSTGLNTNSAAWGTVSGYTDGSYSISMDPSKPTVFYKLVFP